MQMEKSDTLVWDFMSNFAPAFQRSRWQTAKKQHNHNIKMKKKTALCSLLALMVAAGCGEKKAVQAPAPVSVKTMVVGSGRGDGGQGYSGTIEEEDGSSLSFATMGTVESINVGEGQFVSRGQLVGVLNSTTARQAYASAVAQREQAADAQSRMKMLHDNGSLPEIKWVETQTQVKQAQAAEQIARKSLADTRLYAPYSGYVTKKLVEAGANVGPGVPVVQLVRIDRVKVKISVPEEEIARVRQGMALSVRVPALGGRVFQARVTEKNVAADALSRSYEVKALIANASHQLLPGMLAEVDVPGAEPSAAAAAGQVLLPAGIVQLDEQNRTFVWTVAGGKARQTFITTGPGEGDKVSVVAGLHAGDRVISEGQQKVSSGMAVKESN